MNIESGQTPLVLLCPAWKRWGTAKTVKPGATILHSRHDDVVPFSDSEELAARSGLPSGSLVEVGTEHRLADEGSLAAMLRACESAGGPPELVDVTVYYLEMLAPSHRSVPAPREGLTVMHVREPSVAYYRFLYQAVGSEYHWLSRRKLSDDELAGLLRDPRNELYVLHVDGSPAGFAELDRRQAGDVELVQFGLMPEYIGQGLGTWFLQWTIDRVWSDRPKRFWLHTCTLDHPAALAFYKKAGFVEFRQEAIRREL